MSRVNSVMVNIGVRRIGTLMKSRRAGVEIQMNEKTEQMNIRSSRG
jgi:hypothetical protein